MAFALPPQLKKFILIALAIAATIAAFTAVLTFNESRKEGDPIYAVSIGEKKSLINFGGDIITVPAPEGYCFLNHEQPFDKMALGIVGDMQKNFQNHLWLVFADCNGLAVVRKANDLNAYIDTGMIVTPLANINDKMKADVFIEKMKAQLQHIDKPARPELEDSDASAAHFRLTYPIDGGNTGSAHTLSEVYTVTSVKDRPLVLIFNNKNLDKASNPGKTYLPLLQGANR